MDGNMKPIQEILEKVYKELIEKNAKKQVDFMNKK